MTVHDRLDSGVTAGSNRVGLVSFLYIPFLEQAHIYWQRDKRASKQKILALSSSSIEIPNLALLFVLKSLLQLL